MFSSSDVDTSKKVSVSGQNSSIQDIIQQILQGQNGLDYEIQGKKIIVKRQLTGTSNSHNKKKVTVKGKVLDVMVNRSLELLLKKLERLMVQ